MARQVTSEERNILLSHPEFVMFDPYMLKLGKPMLALSFLPLLFTLSVWVQVRPTPVSRKIQLNN